MPTRRRSRRRSRRGGRTPWAEAPPGGTRAESRAPFARGRAREVTSALRALDDAIVSGHNAMPVSIRAAHAGVTTGEWADALRKRFGEYRAPTGVVAGESSAATGDTESVRKRVRVLASRLG